MGEEKATNVGPIGIEVAYERFGDPAAPPVLLMMGGGAQMIDWQVRASRVVGSPGFEAVPGAELVIIDGMGHSLPRQLWPELATRIAELVHRAEAIRAAA